MYLKALCHCHVKILDCGYLSFFDNCIHLLVVSPEKFQKFMQIPQFFFAITFF